MKNGGQVVSAVRALWKADLVCQLAESYSIKLAQILGPKNSACNVTHQGRGASLVAE
jgi:hypothetical protein